VSKGDGEGEVKGGKRPSEEQGIKDVGGRGGVRFTAR